MNQTTTEWNKNNDENGSFISGIALTGHCIILVMVYDTHTHTDIIAFGKSRFATGTTLASVWGWGIYGVCVCTLYT